MADLRDEVIDALDYWTPLTLRHCADAGVIEALGRDERSVADVAADLGLHAETLGRMVRLLAAAESSRAAAATASVSAVSAGSCSPTSRATSRGC